MNNKNYFNSNFIILVTEIVIALIATNTCIFVKISLKINRKLIFKQILR